jgi:hypothetical protein
MTDLDAFLAVVDRIQAAVRVCPGVAAAFRLVTFAFLEPAVMVVLMSSVDWKK